MKRNNLLEELAFRPVCGDGAMGTLLMARGMNWGDCGIAWNIDRYEEVKAIFDAYRAAGSRLITTHSFGGSRFALRRHGRAGEVRELNLAAARIARAVAGDDTWVLGDVGPCGDFIEPVCNLTCDEVRDGFRDQIQALLEGGADAILVETMSDPQEMELAIETSLSLDPGIPVIATYAFRKSATGEYHTLLGNPVDQAVRRAVDAGARIVGANCGVGLGMDDYVALCREIKAAAGDAHVIIQPNAGAPQPVDDRVFYQATPDQMATTATRLVEAGARIVGGCCGTTPAHLAAIAGVLQRA